MKDNHLDIMVLGDDGLASQLVSEIQVRLQFIPATQRVK